MNYRCFASMAALAAVAIVASLAPASVAGQAVSPAAKTSITHKAGTPPRTPDGQPDLQGVWTNNSVTPLERPKDLGTKEFFTDLEAANFEKEENRRQNRDLIDPKQGGLNYPPGGVVPYNEVWYERGDKVVKSKRTSLIVDPPDGRLPALTPDGQKRAALRAAAARDNQLGRPHADSWEDRPLQERCIMGLNAGPPMTPGAYNNNVQLFQTPGYVTILTEMVHDARVIPLDGRPHLGQQFRQWKGDSRGRWEGNTLVVDTTNFYRETSMRGSTANIHLVERFTRVDADTLLYEFTVTDPTTWTRPWTASVPMTRSKNPIYEYACHEGNYGMTNLLSGARALEKAGRKGSR